MRFKTETKNRIQALKYRDGLENHQIAREMGISQTMIWQYIQGLEKQIEKGEITVADIVKSCNALKIVGPKNVRKQEADEMLSEQGMTQKELSENVQALDEALSKAGELPSGISNISTIQKNEGEDWKEGDFIFLDEKTGKYTNVPPMAQGGIINDSDEKEIPIKRNYGGRPKMVVEVDGEPINIKKPANQSDYVLTIMGHIYDELVAGKLALKYYLMEDGVHELQFVEVRKK
jgi:predicted transcriptional regulator